MNSMSSDTRLRAEETVLALEMAVITSILCGFLPAWWVPRVHISQSRLEGLGLTFLEGASVACTFGFILMVAVFSAGKVSSASGTVHIMAGSICTIICAMLAVHDDSRFSIEHIRWRTSLSPHATMMPNVWARWTQKSKVPTKSGIFRWLFRVAAVMHFAVMSLVTWQSASSLPLDSQQGSALYKGPLLAYPFLLLMVTVSACARYRMFTYFPVRYVFK